MLMVMDCTHSLTDGGGSPRKTTASSSGAVRVRGLAQGHLDTQLAGAGDRTSNLAVTNRTALPPELLPPHVERRSSREPV